VGLKPVGVRRYWGSGPWGALPLGWYHQQVMTMNICSLGHHRTQPRPARAALTAHCCPAMLFAHTNAADGYVAVLALLSLRL
jgi:hypothetical protein